MNEIRKLALTFIQDFAAMYGTYINKPCPTSLYTVVDNHDHIAQAIVYAVGNNDYRWLREFIKYEISYVDTQDDLYKLAVKIANLV